MSGGREANCVGLSVERSAGRLNSTTSDGAAYLTRQDSIAEGRVQQHPPPPEGQLDDEAMGLSAVTSTSSQVAAVALLYCAGSASSNRCAPLCAFASCAHASSASHRLNSQNRLVTKRRACMAISITPCASRGSVPRSGIVLAVSSSVRLIRLLHRRAH